jgi:hypothetical protein
MYIQKKLTKIWVWNPGSEFREKAIQDPGVKKTLDLGSGSATPLPNYWDLKRKINKLLTGPQRNKTWTLQPIQTQRKVNKHPHWEYK